MTKMAIVRISTKRGTCRSDEEKRKANSTSNSNGDSTSHTSTSLVRSTHSKLTLPLQGFIVVLMLVVQVLVPFNSPCQCHAFLQQPQPHLLVPDRSSFWFASSSYIITTAISATNRISQFNYASNTNLNDYDNRKEMRKLVGYGFGPGLQLGQGQGQKISQRRGIRQKSLAVITALAAVTHSATNDHSSTGDSDSTADGTRMNVNANVNVNRGTSRSTTNSRNTHVHSRNRRSISSKSGIRNSIRRNRISASSSSSALHATSSEDLKSNNERERRRRSKKNKKKRLFKRRNSGSGNSKNTGNDSSNEGGNADNDDNTTNSAERLSRAVAKASAERRREEEGGKRGINFSFYDKKNYYYYDNDDNDNDNTNADSGYDDNIGKDGRQRRKNDYGNTYYNEDTFSSTSLSSSNEYGYGDQNELDYDGYTNHVSSQPTNKHDHSRGDDRDNSYGNSRSNYNDNSSSRDRRKNPHGSSYSDNGHDEINTNTSQSQSASSFSSSASPPPSSSVASLTQLTQIIDSQLYANGPRGSARGDYPPLNGVVQNARDNMISLLGFNQVAGDWKSHSVRSPQSTYNVAIVFGKDLVRDQITVEYASRIRTLGRLFKDDEDFRPSLVCFCGGIADGNHVSNADAGYIFFRHMCEAQNIDLGDSNVVHDNGDGTSANTSASTSAPPVGIFIDNASRDDDDIVHCVTEKVKNDYIPIWLESTPTVNGLNQKVVDVHFTLISTEYHLCNINDVHHRSPQQSLLTAVEVLGDSFKGIGGFSGRQNMSNRQSPSSSSGLHHFYEDDYDLYRYGQGYPNANANSSINNNMRQKSSVRGVVKTSWSFQYATYPYIYAKDEATVFLGKCYLLGEELMPLLINMRGVVEQREFFQRDNYLMLTSIRRSLVNHIEELHKSAPSIKTALIRSSQNSFCENNKYEGGRDIVTILEGSLLSLGRCVDLVKPAGLHIGSVSKSEWKRALDSLEHSMSEIRDHCDPDRPLRPSEWGKLIDEEKGTLQI